MATININRLEAVNIAISITDSTNSLVGKRVTASFTPTIAGAPSPAQAPAAALKKISALPGSSADVTIATQVAGSITGTINMKVADYASLPNAQYAVSLWVDDGAGNDRCVTAGGYDLVVINSASPR